MEDKRVNEEPDRLAILEALLFVAEEPLPLPKLQEVLMDGQPSQTEATVRELALRLEGEGRGLMVQEVAGGFRLTTRPETHAWVQKLQMVKPARLSRAALETLAIVAYRQPVTRAEIEAIRGVAVDGVMRTLLERDLVRMMGRKAEAGRPMLYGTSAQFLEQFGLKDLGDLPTLREINELINAPEGEAVAGATVGPAHPVEGSIPTTDNPDQPVENSASTTVGDERPIEGSATAAESLSQSNGGSAATAENLEQSADESSSTTVGSDQRAPVDSTLAARPAGSGSGGEQTTETTPGAAPASRPA
jgi:segregation and condensation protein B